MGHGCGSETGPSGNPSFKSIPVYIQVTDSGLSKSAKGEDALTAGIASAHAGGFQAPGCQRLARGSDHSEADRRVLCLRPRRSACAGDFGGNGRALGRYVPAASFSSRIPLASSSHTFYLWETALLFGGRPGAGSPTRWCDGQDGRAGAGLSTIAARLPTEALDFPDLVDGWWLSPGWASRAPALGESLPMIGKLPLAAVERSGRDNEHRHGDDHGGKQRRRCTEQERDRQ